MTRPESIKITKSFKNSSCIAKINCFRQPNPTIRQKCTQYSKKYAFFFIEYWFRNKIFEIFMITMKNFSVHQILKSVQHTREFKQIVTKINVWESLCRLICRKMWNILRIFHFFSQNLCLDTVLKAWSPMQRIRTYNNKKPMVLIHPASIFGQSKWNLSSRIPFF